MRRNLLARIILVLVVMGTAFILGWPPRKVPLGLDLAGGMHLVFHVETDDAVGIYVDQTIGRIKELLARRKITVGSITKRQMGRFTLAQFSPEDEGKLRDLLDEYLRDWDYTFSAGVVNLNLKYAAERSLRTETVDQALTTINNRVDLFGVSEPTIQRQGGAEGNRIVVELPGITNPERAMNLIRTTALLEWKLVHAGPFAEEETLLQSSGGVIPEDREVVKGDPRKTEGGFYLVSSVATITGQDLSSVHLDRDEMDNPAVGFELKPEGSARFARLTGENIGKPVAIILDGRVQSAPTIQDRISDRGIIRGRFSIEEVRDLIVTLKSGALPASMKILENRTIGPSLGADSVRRGLIAIVASFLITLLFMVFYYRGAGINAVVALMFNLVILAGTLGALVTMKIPVALTLPGIAGIILTIGMSVDANVLIFERIREELKSGRSVPSSIGFGFSRALSAIIDSNVTTVIAAFFLIQWGTGPIKGFAVTLIIGVCASLFTAVIVSRLIFDLVVPRHRKVEKLSI